MNERIKRLWNEAALSEPDPTWEGQERFIEKFALLIIEHVIGKIEAEADLAWVQNQLWTHSVLTALAVEIVDDLDIEIK